MAKLKEQKSSHRPCTTSAERIRCFVRARSFDRNIAVV